MVEGDEKFELFKSNAMRRFKELWKSRETCLETLEDREREMGELLRVSSKEKDARASRTNSTRAS